MAKLIFTLNSAGKASDLYRMAQDQDFLKILRKHNMIL